MELKVDVCVVGSGAGGAAAATELALGGAKVAVLEAGGKAPKSVLGEPLRSSLMRFVKDRPFYMGRTRGGTFHLLLHGRCEGGSTAINNGNAFRIPEFVQRDWSKAGADDLSSYFDRVDTFLQTAPMDAEHVGPSGRKFLSAVQKLGWRGGLMPRNAPGCTGRTICNLGCPEDAKRATHISYLPVAREHGAQVIQRADVERVLLEGKRAVGVKARGEKGEEITVKADKVVVAGGALRTPALLQKSGVTTPGLGENLLLHPAILLASHYGESLQTKDPEVSESVYSDEFLESEGFFLMEMGASQTFAMGALLAPLSARSLAAAANTGLWGALIHDEMGAGTVRADKDGSYRVQYALREIELSRMRLALLKLAEAAFAAGAEAVTPVYLGAPRVKSVPELDRKLPKTLPWWRIIGGSVHHMGSCAIGTVCEGDGSVRGMENLYVADASLMPTACGVTPQMPTMSLATCVAAHLLDAA